MSPQKQDPLQFRKALMRWWWPTRTKQYVTGRMAVVTATIAALLILTFLAGALLPGANRGWARIVGVAVSFALPAAFAWAKPSKRMRRRLQRSR